MSNELQTRIDLFVILGALCAFIEKDLPPRDIDGKTESRDELLYAVHAAQMMLAHFARDNIPMIRPVSSVSVEIFNDQDISQMGNECSLGFLPIEILEISARTARQLRRDGVHDVNRLLEDEMQTMKTSGMGKVGRDEVTCALKRKGLTFKNSYTGW